MRTGWARNTRQQAPTSCLSLSPKIALGRDSRKQPQASPRPRNEGVPGSNPGVGFLEPPLRRGFSCAYGAASRHWGNPWGNPRFEAGLYGKLRDTAQAMSQENVELAREVLDMLGKRDGSRLVALADPEVEWHSFFAVGEGDGTYRGHDGTRRYMSDLDDAFEIGRADVDAALGVG